MTTPTWAEAKTPKTSDEFREDLLAAFPAPTVSGWTDGAPQRAFIEGESRALAAGRDITNALAATASPTTCVAAGSSWVDAVMAIFDLDNGQGGKGRILATYAVWQVPMVVTAAAAPITIDSSSVIQVQAADGTIFNCIQASAVTLGSGSLPTAYKGVITFKARLPGTSGNLNGSNPIKKVITGPAGLSVDLTGPSQVKTSTARNDENDGAFIARGLGQWAREGAGWTRPAFDFLIPTYGNNGSTLAVTKWGVDESNPNGPGTVQVAISNAAGPASDAEVTAVNTGLNGLPVKPVGAGALTVVKSTAHNLTINVTLTTDGSNGSVGAQAAAALQFMRNEFPLGPATLEPDLVSAIVRGSPIDTAAIATGTTYETIRLGLAGFSSVLEVTSLDLVAPEVLAPGEDLILTVNVTVLP